MLDIIKFGILYGTTQTMKNDSDMPRRDKLSLHWCGKFNEAIFHDGDVLIFRF